MTKTYAGGLGWLVLVLTILAGGLSGGAAHAQASTWVQIEAQPSLSAAEERARAYAGAFPDVAGFALSSGWYAILLGPYTPEVAEARLADLRRERLIPSDSFIAEGANFRTRYWPAGADATLDVIPTDPAPTAPTDQLAALPEPEPAPPVQPDETPAQARAAEAALTAPDREALQAALQWFGFYASTIDGAFGPGTRTAMADWQAANAAEPTGILTTTQRAKIGRASCRERVLLMV